MGHWASDPYIWRAKGRNYVVEEEGYKCIYVTAVYPELILFCVLSLSRKISAWYLRGILVHSPFFPFHRSSTNVLLVPATMDLRDSLRVIKSRSFNVAKENHETEHDFRPNVLT